MLDNLKKNPQAVLATLNADQVADILEQASIAYYNTSTALISDDLFDLIKAHLKKIAPAHPYLKKIGAPVLGEKAKLPYWMGSLDKIRDDPKALAKWKAKYEGNVVVSDKLDGNSAMVVYEKGSVRMYSRGDGVQGQDISHIIPFLRTVPKHGSVPVGTAVRGELIISKRNWAPISHMGANARNMVAGVMHSKTPDATVASRVEFVAYDLLAPRNTKLSMSLQSVAQMGFKVVHNEIMDPINLTSENLSDTLIRRRRDSKYEIDGIVVIHDEVHKIVKGKNPQYGFAFKSILTHEEAEVIIRSVEWNASKDGYLKPLVHFDTVVLAGAKISKATGFNAQFIEKHAIGPGSRLVIIRSGDVIPHILRVLSPSSAGTPSFPDVPYKWNDTSVDIMVEGETSDVKLRRMEHFCATLEAKNVAAGTLRKLYDHGVDSIPKLLALKEEDVLKMDGFQKTSAQRVVAGLQAVKNAPCEDLMVASNLFGRGFGKKKIALLIQHFPQILERKVPTAAEVENVGGIGATTARAFLAALPSFYKFLDDVKLSCKPTKPATPSKSPSRSHNFQGMTIVFTGFRNKDWEAMVTSHGGKMGSSVSKSTSLVVAADPNETSGKIQKARELNVHVISKQEFAQEYHLQ
jgi:NAD-dependent DNA ligase